MDMAICMEYRALHNCARRNGSPLSTINECVNFSRFVKQRQTKDLGSWFLGSSSEAGFDDIRRIEFPFENLKIAQAAFRGTVRCTLQDEDNVGKCSLEFVFTEEEFSPHACYLSRWIAESETHAKRPNA